MTRLTITEACEAVGKSHKTLYRHISNGKVSASKTDDGQYRFEPCELERVYGQLKVISRMSSQVQGEKSSVPMAENSSTGQNDSATSKLITKLEEEIGYLREQNAKLTSLVEKAQDAAIRTLGFGSQKFSFWDLFKKPSNPS
jgi:excisionase family DNA binding protein